MKNHLWKKLKEHKVCKHENVLSLCKKYWFCSKCGNVEVIEKK